MIKSDDACPCCSGKRYEACCLPFISGDKTPLTPEQLMRSRYTAYTQANIDYIAKTMRAPANNNFDKADAKQWSQSLRWIGLEVLNSSIGDDHKTGEVEFKATFKQGPTFTCMHEISLFECIDGRWYYVDAKLNRSTDMTSQIQNNTGRNDPCLCGSGKKFKRCCL